MMLSTSERAGGSIQPTANRAAKRADGDAADERRLLLLTTQQQRCCSLLPAAPPAG